MIQAVVMGVCALGCLVVAGVSVWENNYVDACIFGGFAVGDAGLVVLFLS